MIVNEDTLSKELKEIIDSAGGSLQVIQRFRDIEKAHFKGNINVLVEENPIQEMKYISEKFNVQILSKDQFFECCLDQYLPNQASLA